MMSSAGPSTAATACGVIVANSAASPASTVITRSPSDKRTRPSVTKNQSWPGWTRSSGGLRVGWRRILTATTLPVGRLSIQVVRLPARVAVGRITTSSEARTSRSASRSTWSAAASGRSTSRLIVRLPVSTLLMVDGLRLVRAASSSSERPRVLRSVRKRARTASSTSRCSAMLSSDLLRISQGRVHFSRRDRTIR